MSEYHEPEELLDAQARTFHRAIKSLTEELEAIDWYSQRITASSDAALREVLAHNRDDEMEHACMLLEWLRRSMPGWDDKLRTYLFTERAITAIEAAAERSEVEESAAPGERAGDLGIGSLRGEPDE